MKRSLDKFLYETLEDFLELLKEFRKKYEFFRRMDSLEELLEKSLYKIAAGILEGILGDTLKRMAKGITGEISRGSTWTKSWRTLKK